MAEERDNKGAIYKREVWKNIPNPDEKRCLNLPNSNCEKDNLSEIPGRYTEKVVIYKTNTYNNLKEENDNYTCEVCSVECSGIENFKLHIDGKKHGKNLKKLNILEEIKPFFGMTHVTTKIKEEHKFTDQKEYMQFRSEQANPETMSLKNLKLSDFAGSAEDASYTESTTIFCDACKKHFASYQVYHQHLDKGEHLEKNKSIKELMKNIITRSEDGSKFSCEICSKAFTGIVPYKQHLLSSSHTKRHKNFNELEKMTNVTLSSEMSWSCVECGMKFSGIVPFNDHIKGSSHLRLMKKKHLLAKLKKEHPVVLKNTMLEIYGDDKEGKVFDRVVFSETKNAESNCNRGRQQELQKSDYHTRKSNEISSKEDIQEYLFFQDSENDNSFDDVLIEL